MSEEAGNIQDNSIDTQKLQQLQDNSHHIQPQSAPGQPDGTGTPSQSTRKPSAAQPTFAAPPPMYAATAAQPNPTLNQQHYFDYNGQYTGASSSSFRPSKRPRNLTEEEAAAITRNFSRGDFYVGNSAPVRIDPRLPVRLTLGEGDHVHFTVGETLGPM
ncbi:hypothetical protein VNI00_002205 [Paramarasmius palmivorus]|uniref:Uncharacterized protein n=1 Tax=Paramarasmius palmivorus TaxID=297713 RepID=A0AAW0E3Q4_9AGAR